MTGRPTVEYQRLLQDVVGRPGDAGALYRLGCALHDNGRWVGAAAAFARVVDLEPKDHKALTNYGWNLHLSGRTGLGVRHLDRAIEMAPTEGMPRALLAQALGVIGEDEEALRHARKAVELEPGAAINHVALSFCLMRSGHWLEGWKAYEHRFSYILPEFLNRPYRLWRGERVEHLYLEAEQGLGDTIFALRWLREAASRADRVTLYVHGPIYALLSELREMPANVKALPLPQPLPTADAWCPLMSLPAALECDEPFWPGFYISGREWFAPNVFHKKVGIAWAGSPEHKQAHHRDIPLSCFLRLAEIPGIEVHSLQVGPAQGQMSEVAAFGLINDRSPEITNFLDTAKIVAELDLVVCVDTAVAHLAGAMGVPCWMLVNNQGVEFRWGRGETTPWYPSLRLFWRELDEGWEDVMARVDSELRSLVG